MDLDSMYPGVEYSPFFPCFLLLESSNFSSLYNTKKDCQLKKIPVYGLRVKKGQSFKAHLIIVVTIIIRKNFYTSA